MSDSEVLRQTTLHAVHVEAGARLIDFAGWDMPVWYDSATNEHVAVRTHAGIFDLGHMGELSVEGPAAGAVLDYALLLHASKMPVGRARYTMICNEDGGIIDDLIVYRLGEESFLVVANASNAPAVFAQLVERSSQTPGVEASNVELRDDTDRWGLIAVQGPTAAAIVQQVVELEIDAVKYYRIAATTVNGHDGLLARTGYTGEDGFELFVPAEAAPAVWRALIERGQASGLVPAGLAARDTLRLEAGMPLYGNELTAQTTPFDVNSGRLVDFDGPDFVGAAGLAAQAERGAGTHLIGLHIDGRRPARSGYAVSVDGAVVGEITSGALSPTLDHPIAMARVSQNFATGDVVSVDVRGKAIGATIVDLPFRSRPPVPRLNPPTPPTEEN